MQSSMGAGVDQTALLIHVTVSLRSSLSMFIIICLCSWPEYACTVAAVLLC